MVPTSCCYCYHCYGNTQVQIYFYSGLLFYLRACSNKSLTLQNPETHLQRLCSLGCQVGSGDPPKLHLNSKLQRSIPLGKLTALEGGFYSIAVPPQAVPLNLQEFLSLVWTTSPPYPMPVEGGTWPLYLQPTFRPVKCWMRLHTCMLENYKLLLQR